MSGEFLAKGRAQSWARGWLGLKRRLSICSALIFDSSVDAGTPSRPRGTERPGHAALAVRECRLVGVLFVGRQRAGGEAGDKRGAKGSTGEPPRIDRERVRKPGRNGAIACGWPGR